MNLQEKSEFFMRVFEGHHTSLNGTQKPIPDLALYMSRHTGVGIIHTEPSFSFRRSSGT